MAHIPTTIKGNHTQAWLKRRDEIVKFSNDTPFFGSSLSEKIYTSVKKAIPSVIQVSACGRCISFVTYKQDEIKARQIISAAFKGQIKTIECPYTGWVTTYVWTID